MTDGGPKKSMKSSLLLLPLIMLLIFYYGVCIVMVMRVGEILQWDPAALAQALILRSGLAQERGCWGGSSSQGLLRAPSSSGESQDPGSTPPLVS